MKKRSLCCLFAGFCSAVALANPAFDTGANYAPPPWTTGSNQGFGFQPWSLQPSSGDASLNGFFIGDSNNNGGGGGPGIGSKAFGIYANSGQNAVADRPFNAPLAIGEKFSILMDNGFIDNGGDVITVLSDGFAVSQFYFLGGDSNYTFFDGASHTTSLGFTDGGLRLEWERLSGSSYQFTATRLVDNASWSTVTTTTAAYNQVVMGNNNAGSFSQCDAFWNDLQIVPEPNSLTLLAFGASWLLIRRRACKS
jgi:hypothetical protein